MIFRNNNKIKNIYRGTLPISNVYRGGILVYTGEKTYDGLTFEALEPSTIKYVPSSVATAQYSYNTVNWNSANNVTINLNTGDRVFFKGNITGIQSDSSYAHFTMTGKVASSGSIMSLQAGNPQDKSLKYTYEFYKLFEGCTSLVKAPELPATTLTERCYMNLFVSCGLTEPTALPATTLAVRCYQNLFNGCSNLTSAPELPATTMVDNCYANLFLNCSSLTTAPELPATTLDEGCYQGMFYHCTSLTTAPELPATTLVTDCYRNMFNGCSNLNYIKALFTTTPSSSYTANWVKEVASSGTFVKSKNATWNVTGIYGIPSGWTVQKEVDWKGLTFEALEPSTIKYVPSTLSTAQYSYDTVNWETADNVTLNLNKGKKVYFKGNITGEQSYNNYAKFTMTGKVASSGSIMSMQNGDPQDNILKYYYEFYELFINCKSIITAPDLPATTLTNHCYDSMFYGCSKLVTAPALPATTLAIDCYSYMFRSCTSLVTAPELPATTLVSDCYECMFNECSNLNYIKAMFTTTPSSSYTYKWVNGVASTGTFVKNKDATWNVTGIDGIPSGWTVHSDVVHKEYDTLYVSGRYEFKIPKGDGNYYVIDTKNDCEADVITKTDFTSLNEMIIGNKSVADQYEWELFLSSTKLYFDLSFKNNRRLNWTFGTLNANTKYTIGGSNGNYLGTDRALYVNGSKKASSTTKSTYNNTSDIVFFGENRTDVHIGNIKIYEKTGLVYNIVAIMYNGEVAFYDKVNKRFMEITSTPPSQSVTTRATGEKIII